MARVEIARHSGAKSSGLAIIAGERKSLGMLLQVILTSTRPGRACLPIGTWFAAQAKKHGGFEIDIADLKEINLPMMDEPQHPRFQKYEHEHTKKWAARVDAADAFAIVTPEYNFGPPPALINALDYLSKEWAHKPAGFVSYGGMSGGLRAVQMEKQIVTSLKIMPMLEAVALPMFFPLIKDGVFEAPEPTVQAANTMLDELMRWAIALKTLRSESPTK